MHFTDYAQDFLRSDETTWPRHGTRPRISAGNGNTWAIVLAAGEGKRLQSLTTNRYGIPVPKQYCCLRSGPSLLRETLQRASRVAARRRTSVVVAEQHSRWWRPLAFELRASNIVVQPEDRGTANGILLALLPILERDPNARVVILPSDHHVADEPSLARSLSIAVAALTDRLAEIVLLGVTPDDADPELGYIAPDGPEKQGLVSVAAFVEKPPRARATKLIAAGALWNTFIIAANGRELLELMRSRAPSAVTDLRRCALEQRARLAPTNALRAVYRQLPVVDFSRDVAQENSAAFHALRVPSCGWSDLGTVDRVRKTLNLHENGASAADVDAATVSLARAFKSERLPAHTICDLTDELGVGAIEMVPAG